MRLVAALLIAAAALLVSCGAPTGSRPPDSSTAPSPAGGPPKVVGTITAGPVCPVEKNPPDPQCAPRPVAGAVVIATNASGEEIGRATTAADGSYELVVDQTGTVLLTAQPVTGLMGAPQPVSVALTSPQEVEHVDLSYDTGIR